MSYIYGQTKAARERAARTAANRYRAERRRHKNLIRLEAMLRDPQEVIAEAEALALYLRHIHPEHNHLGPQRLEAATAECYGRTWRTSNG